MQNPQNNTSHTLLKTFFLGGIFFGLCFPIMALGFDIYFKSMDLSWANLIILHQINPIHFIIDSAPVVLSSVSYSIGKYVIVREKKMQHKIAVELEKARKVADFTQQLIQGNFEAEIQLEDVNTQNSLMQLKLNLQNSLEKEKMGRWMNEKIALLMDFFKEEEATLTTFANKLVSNLVHYLNAIQGAIYRVVLEDNEPIIVLIGGYALDRDKSTNQKMIWGEGLLGQVLKNQKTLYLETLPKNYLQNNATFEQLIPKSLLIIPLCYQSKIIGAVEIISIYPLQKHEIEFMERVADNIAHKINSYQMEYFPK
jgi:hypothetical protein